MASGKNRQREAKRRKKIKIFWRQSLRNQSFQRENRENAHRRRFLRGEERETRSHKESQGWWECLVVYRTLRCDVTSSFWPFFSCLPARHPNTFSRQIIKLLLKWACYSPACQKNSWKAAECVDSARLIFYWWEKEKRARSNLRVWKTEKDFCVDCRQERNILGRTTVRHDGSFIWKASNLPVSVRTRRTQSFRCYETLSFEAFFPSLGGGRRAMGFTMKRVSLVVPRR